MPPTGITLGLVLDICFALYHNFLYSCLLGTCLGKSDNELSHPGTEASGHVERVLRQRCKKIDCNPQVLVEIFNHPWSILSSKM